MGDKLLSENFNEGSSFSSERIERRKKQDEMGNKASAKFFEDFAHDKSDIEKIRSLISFEENVYKIKDKNK
jgi:hypothetical protein